MTIKKVIDIKNNNQERDYYCNVKFQSMKIDIEKGNIYNCDAAKPQSIDLTWLESNPGQLFNTQLTMQERQMMLVNERNTSCENNCFRAEDVGAISPRIIRQGYVKTHNEIIAKPTTLDLTIGSDCNLTCTYCLKEYSSAWRKDLQDHGNYPVTIDDDRYELNIRDKITVNLSQKTKTKSRIFQLVIDELEILSPTVNTLFVTGGEPFLHNNLFDILDKVKSIPNVIVFSGLGVNIDRLTKILIKLQNFKNITLFLSGENIDKFLEFNRYGNKWEDYRKKVELIKSHNINFLFHSVLSNLSLFGYHDFLQEYREYALSYDFVYKPDFMSVYVMDNQSKDLIKKTFDTDPVPCKEFLFKSLEVTPSTMQIQNLKIFLKEFTSRRNISINELYPKSFIDWINCA